MERERERKRAKVGGSMRNPRDREWGWRRVIRRSTREDGRIRETRERGRENRKRGLRVEEEDGERDRWGDWDYYILKDKDLR